MYRIVTCLVLGTSLLAASPLGAEELRVGVHAETSSIDPNYAVQTHNATISLHIFDALVRRNLDGTLAPGLATAWEAPDDKTWIFKLRDDVIFHDGSKFTAEDVAATIHRVGWLPSPALRFTFYTNKIERAVVVDPVTIRFEMKEPDPILPFKISFVYMIKKECKELSTDDFVRSCPIGTGAYKFIEQKPGELIRVQRFDKHWAGAPAFDGVIFQVITNNASRTAALINGDIDVNSRQDPNDVPRIESVKCCAVQVSGEDRNISFGFNVRPQTDFAFDKAGKPLGRNPFSDVRVRQAVAKAINRDGIVSRVLNGIGKPEGQPFPSEFPGSSKTLKPQAPDIAGARKLLNEAGYPDGFKVTMLCPSGMYTKDRDICQAVAAMMTQIGIATEIDAVPANVFLAERGKGRFAMALWSLGTGQGEVLNTAIMGLHTYDADRGFGSGNFTGYSNPKVDNLLLEASRTFNFEKRIALQAQAIETFVQEDQAIVPINRQMMVTATRANLTYTPRADGMYNTLHVQKK